MCLFASILDCGCDTINYSEFLPYLSLMTDSNLQLQAKSTFLFSKMRDPVSEDKHQPPHMCTQTNTYTQNMIRAENLHVFIILMMVTLL